MESEQHRAALYVPSGAETERWVSSCAALAEMHQWRIRTIIREWEHLMSLVRESLVDVIVAGTRSHLPPDRVPRIEFVDEHRPPSGFTPLRPEWPRGQAARRPRPPSAGAPPPDTPES